MAKLTENVVLFLKSDNRQIFTDKVAPDGTALPDPCPKGTKKITILVDNMKFTPDDKGVDTRKRYKLDDCYAPDVTTLAGTEQYLAGHNALSCQPRSGYNSFVSGEGPTNPKSPKKFSARGTFRIAIVYIQALHMKVLQGGAEGEEAAKLLAVLPQYHKVADKGAKEALALFKTEAVVTKAKDLGLAPDEEEDLKAFMAARKAAREAAKNGNTVQPSAVTKATVEDELEEEAEGEEDVEIDAQSDDSDVEADAEVA